MLDAFFVFTTFNKTFLYANFHYPGPTLLGKP